MKIANKAKHVNGVNDVTFEKTKPFKFRYIGIYSAEIITVNMDLTSATYNTATKTCTNVSCHADQTSVKWGKTYRAYKSEWGIDYVCWECHSDGYY
jgi:predicted CxxxxCH...CXXCH cytochrome family protein